MTKYQQSSQQDIRNWAKKQEKNENPKKLEILKSFNPKKNTKRKYEGEECEKKVKVQKTSNFLTQAISFQDKNENMTKLRRDKMKGEGISDCSGNLFLEPQCLTLYII